MQPEASAMSGTLLARLKADTQAEHDAVERILDLTGEGLTIETYRRHLELFYGFFEPLEGRIAAHGGLHAYGIDPKTRQRAPLVAADLRALGVEDAGRLPLCRDLPEVTGAAEGFGCLYVLEGSTLGGQFISRHIRKVLGVTPDTGGKFFQGYGERTGAMWQAFRQSLGAFATTPEDQSRVVTSAVATFRSLRLWWEVGLNS